MILLDCINKAIALCDRLTIPSPTDNKPDVTFPTLRSLRNYIPPIIPLEYLSEHGEEELYKKLNEIDLDHLAKMSVLFLLVNRKQKINREQMIRKLIEYAKTELYRGSSFLDDR